SIPRSQCRAANGARSANASSASVPRAASWSGSGHWRHRPRSSATKAMSPYGISLLMLVAFAGFGYLAARKLVILRFLQADPRWDHPASRMKSVLVNGFLQRRMIHGERKPGLMHAAIFAGFMVLLLRKLQLIAIGYDEWATYPGYAGGAFATLKDVIELAVLVACGYALHRRLVQR